MAVVSQIVFLRVLVLGASGGIGTFAIQVKTPLLLY